MLRRTLNLVDLVEAMQNVDKLRWLFRIMNLTSFLTFRSTGSGEVAFFMAYVTFAFSEAAFCAKMSPTTAVA